jgi:FkbM family methyltransferase
VRSGVRRRLFEYRVPRVQMRDAAGLVELGSRYGGWIVPGELIEPSWTCYLVGAGGDTTLDLELLRRYGATVRSFDAVAQYVAKAIKDAEGEPRFSAHHAAIAVQDGPLRMQVTHDRNSRSVSGVGLYESADFIELPGRTLPSLMEELGDRRIDLLKIDIEGSEYELVPTLDLRSLGVKVFAVQLHHNRSVAEARRLIQGLKDQGYEPVACRSAVKLTFAHGELL